MSGFTANELVEIVQRVHGDIGPDTRMSIDFVWIENIRIMSYLSHTMDQKIYEVVDNNMDHSAETFGDFSRALDRAIEILKT